jgi:hypothetical protein
MSDLALAAPFREQSRLIIRLALKHRLPTIYPNKYVDPAECGLMSCGREQR